MEVEIIENIVEIQLRKYVDEHDILPSSQADFSPGYSCSITITDDIFPARDEDHSTALALLDFSKASQTVDQEILIEILKSSSIVPNDSSVKEENNFTVSGIVENIRIIPKIINHQTF